MDGPQDRYQWTRQRYRLVYTLFRGAFEHVGPCWAPATRPGHVGFICRAFGDMPSVILSRPSSRSALRSNSVQLMSLGPRTPMGAPFSKSVNAISFPTSLLAIFCYIRRATTSILKYVEFVRDMRLPPIRAGTTHFNDQIESGGSGDCQLSILPRVLSSALGPPNSPAGCHPTA
jgi:hypothetical protein